MKTRLTVVALLCAVIGGCTDSPASIDEYPADKWATNIVRIDDCLGDAAWVDIEGPGAEARTYPMTMAANDQFGHSLLGVAGEEYRVRAWSVPDSVLLRDTVIIWKSEPIDCPIPGADCTPKHRITCP